MAPPSPPRGFNAVPEEAEMVTTTHHEPLQLNAVRRENSLSRQPTFTAAQIGAPEMAALPASDFGAVSDFGRIEFPASPKAPAKWVRIHPETDDHTMGELVRLMIKSWRLPAPSVVISVAGGAASLDLNDKQKLVFRRGLLQAARRAMSTGSINGSAGEEGEVPMAPWIFTGGTNSGVMELVGRTMQGLEPDVSPAVPCIGIAPWGIVSQRQHLSSKSAGVAGAPSAAPPVDGGEGVGVGMGANDEDDEDAAGVAGLPAVAPMLGGGGGGGKKRSRLGMRYVYGSKPDDDSMGRDERNGLDANHSHFLLVDSPALGADAYGTELDLRSALTGYICRQDTPTFGIDEDGDPLPKPPFVLLVVGGGTNTDELVLHHLPPSLTFSRLLSPSQERILTSWSSTICKSRGRSCACPTRVAPRSTSTTM